jgi:hypothetical protein
MVMTRARRVEDVSFDAGHASNDVTTDAAGAQGDAATAPTTGRRTVGLVVGIASLALAAWPPAPLWLVLAAAALAGSVALPLIVADAPRVARALVPVAVVLLALLGGWAAIARATGSGQLRDREHDGGVLVTRAAADDLTHARNPYADDFQRVLPKSWRLVQGNDGTKVGNPVRHHFPYLPAAAIVHIPFVLGARALGATWDPRILGWLAMVAAMVALARRREPAWQRLAAIVGMGGAFSIVFLAWGTNDVFAAALVVLALCLADRHPGWAGATLAVALSAKILLLVLVPPLVLVILATGGVAALRRWWTCPALLAVTCLPLFVANPGAFIDDTVWFNLGKAKPLMPTSGIGLPATYPATFHGPLLGAVTLLGVAIALAVPVLAVRRRPSIWVAGASAGLALLGVLVPARTFQTNYLVLVATLLPLAWLAVDHRAGDPAPELVDAVAPGQVTFPDH